MNIEEIGLTVLLLASQARLLELFRSLEAQGMLQLQVASSITDAERLLAKEVPDIAFIQSRISALSGEIVVRHVRSYLASDARIVLLSGDEEELEKAPALRAMAINLGGSDEALKHAVRELLASTPNPQQVEDAAPSAGEAPPEASLPPAAEEPPPATPEVAVQEAAGDTAPPAAEGEPTGAVAEEERPAPLPTDKEPPPPHSGFASAFEETLRTRQIAEPRPVTEVEAERQAAREPAPKGSRKRRSSVMAPARSLRDFASKTYLSPRRLQRRTVLAIAGVTVCAAAAGYLFMAEHTPATSPKAYPLPSRPAPPVQAPAPPQAAAPKKEEAVVPEAPPAPSKAGRGLRELPPFVVDAEQDTEYGKTHPGWERYLTSRMEYKIFREGTLIKAVQVMAARDETVPGDIFNWARKEFAGNGQYKLQSKEKKGNYLVEKWQAEGAGLTVYRKEPELKMRALVLYFR